VVADANARVDADARVRSFCYFAWHCIALHCFTTLSKA
jgi:hypothetical protein